MYCSLLFSYEMGLALRIDYSTNIYQTMWLGAATENWMAWEGITEGNVEEPIRGEVEVGLAKEGGADQKGG